MMSLGRRAGFFDFACATESGTGYSGPGRVSVLMDGRLIKSGPSCMGRAKAAGLTSLSRLPKAQGTSCVSSEVSSSRAFQCI